MKKTAIIYWVLTILISALMLFSAIGGIVPNKQSIDFMNGHLHYPIYLIPFISIAKVLGVLAILIPGMRRIKEWAYAGLAFDLIGAIYSLLSVGDPVLGCLPIVVGLLVLVGSYIYYHKKLKEAA